LQKIAREKKTDLNTVNPLCIHAERDDLFEELHIMSSNSFLVPLISREIITEGGLGRTHTGGTFNKYFNSAKNLGHLIPLK